jgi:hypothetical protein
VTALTDAELATLAWRGPFEPCTTCQQTQNHRCLTRTGARTSPHKPRLDNARGWVARQPDLDALTAQVSNLATVVDSTEAALRLRTTERDDLRIELQRATLEAAGLAEEVGRVAGDLTLMQWERDLFEARAADIAAELAAHMATHEPPAPTLLVGAAVGGNSDPAPLETALGRPLGLRRTYWSAAEPAQGARMAGIDQAAGRTPFISFKCPYPWVDMAAGKGDKWAVDIATRLNALPGLTWLVIHHEPEGDQADPDAWVETQRRLLPILASPKIRTGICLTGYPQVRPEVYNNAYTFERMWPGDMAQFLAVDIYQRYGTTDAGLKWTPLDEFYGKVAAFAASVGVPWGTGETGVTDEAFAIDPQEMNELFATHREHGAEFLCYFNSSLNSKGSWPLTGDKLAAFVAEAG